MNKSQLLLTFDYELPMGSCKSYNKGIFDPTAELLNVSEELKVPIVLFADICSAMMFKKWDYDNYYLPFKNQLQNAIKKKNDVQLHIHPHWLSSQYTDGKYIPSTKFSIGSHINEIYPNNIEGIVEKSIDEINSICLESDPDYKCIAFRAGGYVLEPNTAELMQSLYKFGIRIDSSVVKGMYTKTELLKQDYRKVPKNANWFISLDGDFRKSSESGIFEIPVTSISANFNNRLDRMIKKYKNKDLYKTLNYDHTGTGFFGKAQDFTSKLLNAWYSPFVLSFDNLTTDLKVIKEIISKTLDRHKDEHIILCFNSHPKTFGKHQKKLMIDTVNMIREDFNDKIEFTTFKNLYSKLEL